MVANVLTEAKKLARRPPKIAGLPLLTEAQLAVQLNLSPLTLKDWRLHGGRGPKYIRFPGKKQGTGYAIRYKQEDVDSWLAALAVEAVKQREASGRTAPVHREQAPPSPRTKRRLRAG
jgi:hypothetical protein